MTEQDCSQVVTHYEGNKFGHLYDISLGPGQVVVVVGDDDNKSTCVSIVVLDDRLNLLKVIVQGSDNGRLFNPDGVAVKDNIIAVSDYGSHQVKKYSLQGELLSIIGCYGHKNGQFNYPRGLAFNNNKFLYVVDGNNYRVQVFKQDDMFAFSFGNRGINTGQFQWPDRIVIDPNYNVLVTDYKANCIHVFSHSGQFIQTINCCSPHTITISHTGYLITGHDGNDNKIRVRSPTYQLIKQFGKKGSKQGEFCDIRGMPMDSSGTVYVVEWVNKRLQVINNG